MSTEMRNVKEMVAMIRAAKIISSVLVSKAEDRKDIVCAQFDETGSLLVRIDGRNDFVMVAMSALFHDLAAQADIDPEEMFYTLMILDKIKGDLDKKDTEAEEAELKIKFKGEWAHG